MYCAAPSRVLALAAGRQYNIVMQTQMKKDTTGNTKTNTTNTVT